MATDHRFDPYGDEPQNGKRPTNWLTNCLIGCLIVVVVGLVVGAFVAYWVSQNWRGWVSQAGTQAIVQNVDASDLPEQEKQEIKVQVDRVADAFREGRLPMERVGVLIEKVMESPILPAIVVFTADAKYLNQSGLSDEEKAEGRVTLQRFVRGASDGTIDQESVDKILTHIADRQPDGTWRLREEVTDEELRALIAEAKAEADAANVPDEPEPFDPSDEIQRIIDEALADPAVMPPNPAPAAAAPLAPAVNAMV